jgi:hypothetical protein
MESVMSVMIKIIVGSPIDAIRLCVSPMETSPRSRIGSMETNSMETISL